VPFLADRVWPQALFLGKERGAPNLNELIGQPDPELTLRYPTPFVPND